MPLTSRRSLLTLAAASTTLLAAMPALAQSAAWPAKPITFVVPNPPGGVVDTSANAQSTMALSTSRPPRKLSPSWPT